MAQNTVSQIATKLTLSATWNTITLGLTNSGYFTLLKNATKTNGYVDRADVTEVVIDLAVDSGLTDAPIVYKRLNFRFNTGVTPNAVDDKRLAAIQINELIPNKAYYRVEQFTTISNGVKLVHKNGSNENTDITLSTVAL